MPRVLTHSVSHEMRIRILKALPPSLDGFDLRRYQVGAIYDIGRSLSELLIVSGYAEMEEDRQSRPDKPTDSKN